MRRFKDRHQSGVLLGVNQVDVGVNIIIFDGLNSGSLFLVPLILFFLFSLVEMRLDSVGCLFYLVLSFLVELNKIFLVVQHFF